VDDFDLPTGTVPKTPASAPKLLSEEETKAYTDVELKCAPYDAAVATLISPAHPLG
jgi:hypothetical protein